MAIDLLSYKGDANLGLGSNPNIGVSADPSVMDSLNQAARDISTQNSQTSYLLYKQKIDDRDKLIEMLASDQVSTGAILPEYLKEIEAAKAEQEKAFTKWGGNMQDIAGQMEYKKAAQKAKDLAIIAQANTASIAEIRKNTANEPLRFRQKQMIEFEKNELKRGLSDFVRPYQKNAELNVDATVADLLSGGLVSTSEKKGDKNSLNVPRGTPVGTQQGPSQTSPFIKSPDTVIKFDDILGRSGIRFMEGGEKKEQQDLIRGSIESLPAEKAAGIINDINKRIAQYNEETKGINASIPLFKEGDNYRTVGQDGAKHIEFAMETPEIAARFALAQHKGPYFQPGKLSLDKDIASYLKGLDELKAKWAQLRLNGKKTDAYVKNLAIKTKKLQSAGVDENTVTLMSQRWQANPVVGLNIESNIPGWSWESSGKSTTDNLLFDVTEISDNYRNVLLVIDDKGNQINVPPTFFVDPNTGKQYLKGGDIYDRATNTVVPVKKEEVSKLLKVEQERYRKTNGEEGIHPDRTIEETMETLSMDIKEKLKTGQYKATMVDRRGRRIDPSAIADAYRNLNNKHAAGKYKNELFETTEEPPLDDDN